MYFLVKYSRPVSGSLQRAYSSTCSCVYAKWTPAFLSRSFFMNPSSPWTISGLGRYVDSISSSFIYCSFLYDVMVCIYLDLALRVSEIRLRTSSGIGGCFLPLLRSPILRLVSSDSGPRGLNGRLMPVIPSRIFCLVASDIGVLRGLCPRTQPSGMSSCGQRRSSSTPFVTMILPLEDALIFSLILRVSSHVVQ